MDSIEEKRVYGDREGALEVYVSSSTGVVRVRVAGTEVGEFGLCDRRRARDVAATADGVAVATDEDVRVMGHADDRDADSAGSNAAGGTFVDTDFGPAVAVGADDSGLLAAGPDGDLARLPAIPDVDAAGDGWHPLETDGVGTVRAIDADLVGTADGVYRVHGGRLDHAGLSAVRDVSAAGVPLAATADGLYKLGNGWMNVLEGSFETVAADPRTEPGRLRRAHAVSGGTIYAYDADADAWRERDAPADSIVGVGYGETSYAVTDGGTFLAAASDGTWRSRDLGVEDATGLAVGPVRESVARGEDRSCV